MSKHAIGKIYERYISTLSYPLLIQAPLFYEVLFPNENRNKDLGSFYTPEYIASYFTNKAIAHLKDNGLNFLDAKIIDPACGSGMFLRNYAEVVTDINRPTVDKLNEFYQNIKGIDVDYGAFRTTQLSLALLYSALTDTVSSKANIINADAIEFFRKKSHHNQFSIVMCNPPYISSDRIEPEKREIYASFLGDQKSGRKFDMYLLFLKGSIDLLAPSGIGMFIVPHTLLTNSYGKNIRKYISENCEVLTVADLSNIQVFSGVGTYVLLMILRKKVASEISFVKTQIIKALDYPGHALERSLDSTAYKNSSYSIYYISQDNFKSSEWSLEDNISHEISRYIVDKNKPLAEFFTPGQGIVSGDDKLFIVDQPIKGEEGVYKKFIADRKMPFMAALDKPSGYMIYPYENNLLLGEDKLRNDYPKTWELIRRNKDKLEQRAGLGKRGWWSLTWPRLKSGIDRPKIISPNLILLPKFSIDLDGDYAITRSTYLAVHESMLKASRSYLDQYLKFYCCLLNSSAYLWQLRNYGRKYNNGYTKVEVNTVKATYIPDINDVDANVVDHLTKLFDNLHLVDDLARDDLLLEIDEISSSLYGLSSEQIQFMRSRL